MLQNAGYACTKNTDFPSLKDGILAVLPYNKAKFFIVFLNAEVIMCLVSNKDFQEVSQSLY